MAALDRSVSGDFGPATLLVDHVSFLVMDLCRLGRLIFVAERDGLWTGSRNGAKQHFNALLDYEGLQLPLKQLFALLADTFAFAVQVRDKMETGPRQ